MKRIYFLLGTFICSKLSGKSFLSTDSSTRMHFNAIFTFNVPVTNPLIRPTLFSTANKYNYNVGGGWKFEAGILRNDFGINLQYCNNTVKYFRKQDSFFIINESVIRTGIGYKNKNADIFFYFGQVNFNTIRRSWINDTAYSMRVINYSNPSINTAIEINKNISIMGFKRLRINLGLSSSFRYKKAGENLKLIMVYGGLVFPIFEHFSHKN